MTTLVGNAHPRLSWSHSWGAAAIRPGAARRGGTISRPREGSPVLPARTFAEPLPTVRSFVVPAHKRLATAVAQAEIVRDAAGFGALILFATMLALVLGGADAPF